MGEPLIAARFGETSLEQDRRDIIEWLDEALKTKGIRQPALYLGVLDPLSADLNQLPTDTAGSKQFMANRAHSGQAFQALEQTLRALPLPPSKDLKADYFKLLDQ